MTGTPDITVRNINSAGIGTIATLNATDFTTATLKGHSTIRSIHGTTTTFIVTVASKTSAHRYNGSGSSNGYKIDGVEAPFITLTPLNVPIVSISQMALTHYIHSDFIMM